MFTVPLGSMTLDGDALKQDKKNCRKAGPCGAGELALYVGSRFLSRYYYIPWQEVRRVFKRVAMSPGGFSGKGVFGSMAYLVVQYGSGREKACYFRLESDVDRLLSYIKSGHPYIPLTSETAEKKLKAAETKERRRYKQDLSEKANETLRSLDESGELLRRHPETSEQLSAAAKQKRIVDNIQPPVIAAGGVCMVCGLLIAVFGLYDLAFHRSDTWMYFLLGGGALFFFTFTSGLYPNKWTSRKYAEEEWNKAVSGSEALIRQRKDFPVPAQYAHYTVIDRMMRLVHEGRADSTEKAFEELKKDLQAANAAVTVSQQEHDEIVEIKPMFLVCDYK